MPRFRVPANLHSAHHAALPACDHGDMLSILAGADRRQLKAFAEPPIELLPGIKVIENRIGLVMLPMADTAQGIDFHLGEVLMSEARIAADGQEGWGSTAAGN